MTFDPKKPCQTRDGNPVTIVVTDWPGETPILGRIGDNPNPTLWFADGAYPYKRDGKEHPMDLVNLPPQPRVGWVLMNCNLWIDNHIYLNKKDADNAKVEFSVRNPMDEEWILAKVEWEE